MAVKCSLSGNGIDLPYTKTKYRLHKQIPFYWTSGSGPSPGNFMILQVAIKIA